MRRKSFTLVEVMMSVAISVVFLTGVLSIWHYTSSTWATERLENELRYQLQKAVEQIKAEVRLSTVNEMYFYKPPASLDYEAISFPRAIPDETTGLLQITAQAINWDETVIYHVYQPDGEEKQLRRTVFYNRRNNMSSAARQAQLDYVAENGTGVGAEGAGETTNPDPDILFKNLVTLTIIPQTAEFDGYSPTTELSPEVSLGSISLAPGAHDFEFMVSGQNVDSGGFGLGIDTLRLSPSGHSREGESYSPTDTSVGDGASIVDMSAFGGEWSGNRQLEFSANEVGDYMFLSLDYESIEECNFEGCSFDDVQRTELANHNPAVELPTPDEENYILWEVTDQTSANPHSGTDSVIDSYSIRNIIYDGFIPETADKIKLVFSGDPAGRMTIDSPYIARRLSVADAVLNSESALTFGGSTSATISGGAESVETDWEIFDIADGQDYLVSFWAYDPTPPIDALYWTESGTTLQSYRFLDAGASHAAKPDWSTLTPLETQQNIYTLSAIKGWAAQGTVTSPIYDTKLLSPVYTNISWTEDTPANTDVTLRVRSSANPDMSGAADWASIAALTDPDPASPNIAGIGPNRFVQFQATLSSLPSYDNFPGIDDVKIEWTPPTALVEVSGRFTRRDNYGKFVLYVDNEALAKGLEIKITVQKTFRGENYEVSLTTEAEPRN